MNLPRLINPMSVSLTLNIRPLSTATMRLPKSENLPARGFVELFTPYGSAGVFRVQNPDDSYGQRITQATLEHAIAEVGDYLVKAEISEMMAANKAMQTIFEHYKGKMWQLGSVSALGSGKIAVSAKYNRVLDVMNSIMDQKKDCMLDFDFSTFPWTVKAVKRGTTVAAEGRLERNISSTNVDYDDTEMCTRAFYQTWAEDSSGTTKGTWHSKDADTKSTYGVIEREVPTTSDMTDEEVMTAVDAYLAEHKKPRVSVTLEGEELYSVTGESMDRFTLGKLFRLAIPEYSVIMEDHIISVSWNDVYRKPRQMNVRVGDPEDSVVTFLHNLDAKGSGGGGGGKKKKDEEDKEKEYRTHFTKTDKMIAMDAQRISKAESIFEQAGLKLTSKGVLLYADERDPESGKMLSSKFKVLSKQITSSVKDAKEDLSSQIKQTADTVSVVVSGTGKNAKIKPAAIQASIDAASGTSKIRLSADHIILDGSAVASSLQAQDVMIANLNANNAELTGDLTVLGNGGINCYGDVKGNGGDFVTLTVGDADSHDASWKTLTITVVSGMSSQRYFLYTTSPTSMEPNGMAYGRIIEVSRSETIHYLGY